jgi:hypothetical protein
VAGRPRLFLIEGLTIKIASGESLSPVASISRYLFA